MDFPNGYLFHYCKSKAKPLDIGIPDQLSDESVLLRQIWGKIMICICICMCICCCCFLYKTSSNVVHQFVG